MTSTQKRLSGFVPNRTPRTATENYQITKSQKDTFRDKVYILFNNDQKRTNIFVGMYEEFYKNDDEMYVYFNITYNDLVKAFKGVVTRPETVLKTHEKLLNKFQNTGDDSEDDDQQTIFNSVNTGYTAHDFVRSYAPQESLYNNVPSSTMSLNQPVVDNDPSKTQGGIWPGYSSTKKKGVNWPENSQSNNTESESDDELTTEGNDDENEIDDEQNEPMSNEAVQFVQEIEEDINQNTDDNALRKVVIDNLGGIIANLIDVFNEKEQPVAYTENKDDVVDEFLTYMDDFVVTLRKENEMFQQLTPREQEEFEYFLNANKIYQMKVVRKNLTQQTESEELIYTTKKPGTSSLDSKLPIAKEQIFNLYDLIRQTRLRMENKEKNAQIGNLRKSLTSKNKTLTMFEEEHANLTERLASNHKALESPTLSIKDRAKYAQRIQNKIDRLFDLNNSISALKQDIAQLETAIEKKQASSTTNNEPEQQMVVYDPNAN
jgi:hypothetical protein